MLDFVRDWLAFQCHPQAVCPSVSLLKRLWNHAYSTNSWSLPKQESKPDTPHICIYIYLHNTDFNNIYNIYISLSCLPVRRPWNHGTLLLLTLVNLTAVAQKQPLIVECDSCELRYVDATIVGIHEFSGMRLYLDRAPKRRLWPGASGNKLRMATRHPSRIPGARIYVYIDK